MRRIRNPVVAGRFYPADPLHLRRWISAHGSKKRYASAIGGISPHAGYVFSGDLASEVISSMGEREVFVILGPNHTGLGQLCSVSSADVWRTPLGDVEVDHEVRSAILEIEGMELDDSAHLYEHSIEVQLPIIQVFHPKARIVPITVMAGAPLSFYLALGRALQRVQRMFEGRILWLVSSDMNHYEDHETTLKKDELAIEAILEIDPEKLFNVVETYDISMCGVYPTMILLSLLQGREQVDAKVIGHKTSAEASGDYDQVVGYFGCLFLS